MSTPASPLSSQYARLIAKLGGGSRPRFNPIVWFEDDFPVVNAGAMAPQKVTPQKKITFPGAMWGMQISAQFHSRVAYGAALPAAALVLNDEFPLGFIDRFEVRGSNKRFVMSESFQLLSAATLFRYLNIFRPFFSQVCRVSRNGGAYQQQIGLNANPVAAPTFTANTNTDYDVETDYILPFVPLGIREWIPFLLNPTDWTDLTLNAYVADQTGLFDKTAQANAPTITFGALQGTPGVAGGTAAVAGNPLIRISLIPMMFGGSEANARTQHGRYDIGSRLLYRTEQTAITSPLQVNAGNVLLARLTTQNLPYVRFLLKTGSTPVSNPTNGVQSVINSLTDGLLSLILTRRKTTNIRQYQDVVTAKAFAQDLKQSAIPAGYFLEDFCAAGSLFDAVDTNALTSDDLTILANVIGAAATNIAELLEERVRVA